MIALDAYRGRKIAVFGLGRTGAAAVSAALAGGAEVFAWDDNESGRSGLKFSKARLMLPDAWPWEGLACLVLSPGIALTHPKPHTVVERAKAAGCKIVGDIELLYRACPNARTIGITGTNGKSTTTALLGHILRQNEKTVQVGGNLGPAALALDALGADGTYVLELSSYQLDLLSEAHFGTAVLLNVTSDHTERHGGMEGYVAAKRRIFDRQRPEDAAIIAVDDAHTQKIFEMLSERKTQRVIAVSATRPLEQGVYVDEDGVLHDVLDGKEVFSFDLSSASALPGGHNRQNAAAAYAAARLESIPGETVARAIERFPGLAHRMEVVAEVRGVRFVNDSKATNAEAVAHALAAYEHIYWIAGGRPKEGGITPLLPWMKHVVHAFLIGEAEEEFAKTLEGNVAFTRCGTLENAVAVASGRAFEEGRAGAVVLLSPASASFDQWTDFEARGDAFRAMAASLR